MPVLASFRPFAADRAPRVGLLSTYPPRVCGLATYADALRRSLEDDGCEVRVVAVVDPAERSFHDRAGRATLVAGLSSSQGPAAAELASCDVALVQHEFGIFTGPDGADVLDLLARLDVPVVATLHTVPSHPTPGQRAVLIALAERAERLVVMTEAARRRLLERYPIDADQVVTIPHGAALPERLERHVGRVPTRGPLLTWGLLGPGKGIEHVVDALSLLRDVADLPPYVVAGVTHPKVLLRDGDAYRRALARRASDLGVAGRIVFDGTYRDVESLTRFVAASSIVLLPYDSHDQVTSGVLVDAITAGRPVIATRFPHAVELLASGAGIVVPHEDPAALAAAIRRVLTEPGRADAMAAEARRLAPTFAWPAVARRYAALAAELVAAGQSATT